MVTTIVASDCLAGNDKRFNVTMTYFRSRCCTAVAVHAREDSPVNFAHSDNTFVGTPKK